MAFHDPPPFGDPTAMAELAGEAAHHGAFNIARLVEYGGRQALAAVPDGHSITDADTGAALSRAELAESVGWLSYSLSQTWGVCACRTLHFASGVDGTPKPESTDPLLLGFTDRFLLSIRSYLVDAAWTLDLIAYGGASDALVSALGLAFAELAGASGSFVPLVGGPERHARALSIARGSLWRVQSGAGKTELLAEQLELLYLAYHRLCCRVEVLARCALAERENPALGPMFGLAAAAALAVASAVEATEGLRWLLGTSRVVADHA